MAETMISWTAPNQAIDYRLYLLINTPDFNKFLNY